MFLTIFTPVYNRENTLPRLYASLCQQTDHDFEWLVIDDGSIDHSFELLKQYGEDGKIEFYRYVYQENAGKMMAHNRGVELAQGELFVCVDSDDYLESTAVEKIKKAWESARQQCIGILAYKVSTDGTSVTRMRDQCVTVSTLKSAYDHHGLTGDTMLVFRTDILRKHRFPQFAGEKFVPEGFLYDQLDQEGELYFLRQRLYVCEYLEGGYSANMGRLLFRNPQGYFAYINQRLKIDQTAKERFLDSIRYNAMAIACGKKRFVTQAVYPLWSVTALLPGYLFYLLRYKGLK